MFQTLSIPTVGKSLLWTIRNDKELKIPPPTIRQYQATETDTHTHISHGESKPKSNNQNKATRPQKITRPHPCVPDPPLIQSINTNTLRTCSKELTSAGQ